MKKDNNVNKRILVAMSGGVDSSVSALLLKEQGWEVVGATMILHDGYDPADAQNVAKKMGIEFHVIDLQREFREIIIDRFAAKYERGLTPNPCVDCNREIKFGLLWEKAKELDCCAMATGHYARIENRGNGARLVKAAFLSKDQSYFLHVIPKELLDNIYFPLGDIADKEKTRKIAADAGLVVASKSDSQDICFVPDGDYMKIIDANKSYKKEIADIDEKGKFIDQDGNTLGYHNGQIKYTIGQRRGLGVASSDGRLYVIDKDPVTDTVILGKNEDLFKRELIAGDVNWLVWDQLPDEFICSARIRYRHKEQLCKVRIMNPHAKLKSGFGSLTCNDDQSFFNKHGFASVVFDEPQRAITPGQFIVFYDGDRVLGGGCII